MTFLPHHVCFPAPHEVGESLVAKAKQALVGANLLVFSDFNYGCLPQYLVDDLCAHCRKHLWVLYPTSLISNDRPYRDSQT